MFVLWLLVYVIWRYTSRMHTALSSCTLPFTPDLPRSNTQCTTKKETYDRRCSMLKMCCSFVRDHLSMFVICQTLSTEYPRWNADEIVKIHLSVGLTSSSSMSSM